MPLLAYYRDGLRELTRVHDLASMMWWAESARLSMGGPVFHDCCRDSPLIQHPQALCSLYLSIFSVFPVGPWLRAAGLIG